MVVLILTLLFFFPHNDKSARSVASCVSIRGTEGLYYRSGKHTKYICEPDDLADDISLIV